jgi:hypothetical protein
MIDLKYLLEWAKLLGITEPVNGSWVQAISDTYGTSVDSVSFLEAITKNLGLTITNGSYIQAIAEHYGATEPENGSWLFYIINNLVTSPFPFDSVDDLAFSIRKINPSYSGYCMRIRRSTDNAELDIGFNGVDLDTSAISTFCGTGIGYVVKWYDQSGNSNDMFNTTAVNQPFIYNNGFTLRNGKPYISASSTQYLCPTAPYVQTNTEEFSFFMTYEKSASGNQAILLRANNSYSWYDANATQYITNQNYISISPQNLINTTYLINVNSDPLNDSDFYQNNTKTGTRGALSTVNNNYGGFNCLPSNSFRTATILLSEFIWYREDKSINSLSMRNNINDYYSIF